MPTAARRPPLGPGRSAKYSRRRRELQRPTRPQHAISRPVMTCGPRDKHEIESDGLLLSQPRPTPVPDLNRWTPTANHRAPNPASLGDRPPSTLLNSAQNATDRTPINRNSVTWIRNRAGRFAARTALAHPPPRSPQVFSVRPRETCSSPKPRLGVCTLPANGRVDAEVLAGARRAAGFTNYRQCRPVRNDRLRLLHGASSSSVEWQDLSRRGCWFGTIPAVSGPRLPGVRRASAPVPNGQSGSPIAGLLRLPATHQ